MYRVKPGDECQIHLGAPPLKSYLLEYVSPFKYSIYSFQSCVHCATNTAESNFGAHIFIVLALKEKFGLFLAKLRVSVSYDSKCEDKACLKRRATVVLSWLDCSPTAARH